MKRLANATSLDDDGHSMGPQDLFAGAMVVAFSLFTLCMALVAKPGDQASSPPVHAPAEPVETPPAKPKPTSEEGNLFAKEVHAIFVVDVSPSTKHKLPAIREGIEHFVDVASRLSPKFTIEILTHVNGKVWQRFKRRKINPTSIDGVRSKGREVLHAFLHKPVLKLNLVSGGGEAGGKQTGKTQMSPKFTDAVGYVNTPEAVRRALWRMRDHPKLARSFLCVIGDGALHEQDGDPATFTAEEKDAASSQVYFVRDMFRDRPNARLWTIYTGARGSSDPVVQANERYFRMMADKVEGLGIGPKGRARASFRVEELGAIAVEAVFGGVGEEERR